MTTKVFNKPKILGGKNPNISEQPQIKKWNEGINQQKDIASENINVQMIPVDQIILDPDNPRTISLSLTEIKNAPKIHIDTFDSEEKEQQFLKNVEDYFKESQNRDKKIADYISLALLASSIGHPNNLINPITVYLDGMNFHVLAGHRRTMAHVILNANNIAAKIIPNKLNNFEHSLLQWRENKDREDLSLADELNNINLIISAWETENNSTMSIRKLMAVLNIKKTKASWYLATTHEIKKNPIMKKAITVGELTSLELCYNICMMSDKQARNTLLNEIIQGNKASYKELMARIKNPDISVRTPDTPKIAINKHHGLVIKRQTNVDVISKIIRLLIKSPEFKAHQAYFEKINIASKPGMLAAWEKIHDLLNNNPG